MDLLKTLEKAQQLILTMGKLIYYSDETSKPIDYDYEDFWETIGELETEISRVKQIGEAIK
jgi:hypothetical protein